VTGSCPMCARQLASDMRYCPYCGIRVGEGGASPGTLQMTPPSPYGGMPYPMAFPGAYPYPMMYPPPYRPVTQKRVFGITGGILLIVGGSLQLIPALVLILGWWSDDLLVMTIGLVDIMAFALSIAGAVAAFKRAWRVLALIGPAFLLGASVVTALEIPEFMLMVMPLAILSLIFMALGFGDMRQEGWPGYGVPMPGGVVPPFGVASRVPPGQAPTGGDSPVEGFRPGRT